MGDIEARGRAMNSMSMHQPDTSDINDQEKVWTVRELAKKRDVAAKNLGLDRHSLQLSCDGCHHRFYCMCAMDAYNTDGDCLVMK